MDNKIRKFVYRIRARIREQQIIENLIKFAAVGLLFANGISFISMFVSFYYAIPFAIGIVLLCFVMGIITGIHKTPAPMEAALRADAKGHKEKISTAFFLKEKEDLFSTLQKKDALKVIDTFQIRREFPLRLNGKQVLIVVVLSLVFVFTSLVDTPARELARIRNDVEKEAKEDIARLEKVEKKLEENREISEAEAAEVKEQIEQAKKELSEADSREELKKAEERITKKMEMASEKTDNKTLSETMSKAAKEAREEVKNKENDLIEKAKAALAKAQKGNRKDKQEAYEKLNKLAETIGDEDLKKAAEDYKDSGYADRDYAKAERALNSSVDNLTNNQKDFVNNQNGTDDHASQGNKQSNGQNENQSSGKSDNQQNGESGSGENGQNGTGSKGQNGSGSGNGSGNQGNGSGSGWNYGGKDGREGVRKTNESITVPDGKIGDDENLTGKANGNNSSTKEKSSQSQTWSGNKVSYGEVSGQYKEKAYKKVNGSRYPGKLKNRIRDYFDGLN